MRRVKFAVVGAGNRGTVYADFVKRYHGQVVAVADPVDWRRTRLAHAHRIPSDNIFADWHEMAQRDRFADAVIIATPDRLHLEPALAFAQRGYHMMLEKPMAPTEHDCQRIVQAVLDANIIFAVCHVLRYTDYTRKFDQLLDSGLIGDVVSVQRIEPVGYWHFAHSFVRGSYRREDQSSSMLLAKSCHDIDWICHMMGGPCLAVSSFGALKHYRKENQPEGAAKRCLDCPIEPDCPFSARKIYLGRVAQGRTGWPVNGLVENVTPESVTEALRTGPYGRCVYACDNDVCDNQVVDMLFEGGRTANFMVTGFAESTGRRTSVFGTTGELRGDGNTIRHHDFLTDHTEIIDTRSPDATALGGHGGGDGMLVEHVIQAVATNDRGKLLTGPRETLESHRVVFAAERARRHGCVVAL